LAFLRENFKIVNDFKVFTLKALTQKVPQPSPKKPKKNAAFAAKKLTLCETNNNTQ